MFALLARSRSKLNKSDVQLPAKQEPDASTVEPTPQTETAPAPEPSTTPADAPLQPQVDDARPSASIYSSDERPDVPTDDAPAASTADVSTAPTSEAPQDAEPELELKPQPPTNARRFSFRPLAFKFMNGQTPDERAKPILSAEEEHKRRVRVSEDRTRRIIRISNADRRAKESAVVVRTLIIGSNGITLPKPKPVSKPKVERVKSQLVKPKSANRLIAHLRALPTESVNTEGEPAAVGPAPPIRAVCLKVTDAEVDARHFTTASGVTSVYSASYTELKDVFDSMELVDLVTAPNMGLGASADEPGLFSGAVPTAKTIIEGIEQVTPQLMALGYATGKALLPDHTGIHPPTDRMSVLTYWWGFEVCLPPPSIKYLSSVPSVAHSIINVLTALSVLNEGVREILPFVRYISTFIDTEFNMIKGQDQGKGVVCAATWLLPAALVPRPWDFTPAPIIKIQPAPAEDPAKHTHDKPTHPDVPTSPTSPTDDLPESRPASPPTLLPPLNIHDSSFGDAAVNTAAPTADTPVVAVEHAETPAEGDTTPQEESELPAVSVVPPTPTSVQTADSLATAAPAEA